jgi:hypothetical protein
VIGLDRWVYRVIAYAALMPDDDPPFHLDAGCIDPGRRLTATTLAAAPAPARSQEP